MLQYYRVIAIVVFTSTFLVFNIRNIGYLLNLRLSYHRSIRSLSVKESKLCPVVPFLPPFRKRVDLGDILNR